MPHVSDVRPTSHDHHDLMLVAALAAGDLAGTDRDQAIALTDSCTDCASIRDDLVAIARATKSVPPPLAARPRDFRLTPSDAARLRPAGWRRLVAALAAPRAAVTRPLGVGLATLGLVGLLVGNVQLGFGSSASAPAPQGAAPAAAQPAASGLRSVVADGLAEPSAAVDTSGQGGAAPIPAASGAPAAMGSQDYAAERASRAPAAPEQGAAGPAATGGKNATTGAVTGDSGASTGGEPFRPLNLLFGGAIVVGLGLLVAPRLRGRRTA